MVVRNSWCGKRGTKNVDLGNSWNAHSTLLSGARHVTARDIHGNRTVAQRCRTRALGISNSVEAAGHLDDLTRLFRLYGPAGLSPPMGGMAARDILKPQIAPLARATAIADACFERLSDRKLSQWFHEAVVDQPFSGSSDRPSRIYRGEDAMQLDNCPLGGMSPGQPPTYCPLCHEGAVAPELSEFVNSGEIRHHWLCESCAQVFSTAVQTKAFAPAE
jgi:hypothetical protein